MVTQLAATSTKELYGLVSKSLVPSGNNHVREKIRQTLQRYPEFIAVQRGVWCLG